MPTSEIPELLSSISQISKELDIKIPAFGHAGDGNIHATLLREGMDDATWEAVKAKALHDMYSATYRHGGNLSGEHGIGAKRLGPLERFVDAAQIQVIKSIKAALDPNLILNPGKIVRMA